MKKKTPILNLVLVLMTIMIMFVMIESFLRAYVFGTMAQPFSSLPIMVLHPTRSIALGPGLEGWQQKLDFNGPVNVNAQGLRGADIGPKDDRQRILIVADSTTYGSGVAVEHIIPTAWDRNAALGRARHGSE